MSGCLKLFDMPWKFVKTCEKHFPVRSKTELWVKVLDRVTVTLVSSFLRLPVVQAILPVPQLARTAS
jgi:hypothetical protein